MEDKFLIIAFTPPTPRRDEIEWINQLLMNEEYAVDRIHIRHPGIDIRPILKQIPDNLIKKLSIHDQPELLFEFPGLGFHFNVRNPRTEISGQRVMSMSCHSWAEVQNVKKLDYVTLSPVFDSISKKNYKANHSLLNGWRETSSKVIAMGGVSLENLSSLKNFNGAAMLGTLDCSLKEIPFLLKEIRQITRCFNS